MSTPGAEPADGRVTYTVPESAAKLGISQSFLWKQIKAGAIPVVHLGRRTLISRTALERAVAEREAPAGRLRMVK